MFGSSTQLRCCDAYLRSAAKNVTQGYASTRKRKSVELVRRVLIVEFRDEVFADLKSVLEDHGCEVVRAVSGAEVAAQAKRLVPDLFLVNESMPDESGWLITRKLRLTRLYQPVWLYTARVPQVHADWKESSGVDEILVYGGGLSRLGLQVRGRLKSWLELSSADRPLEQSVGGGINPVAA